MVSGGNKIKMRSYNLIPLYELKKPHRKANKDIKICAVRSQNGVSLRVSGTY
jgi:hypothetical protein